MPAFPIWLGQNLKRYGYKPLHETEQDIFIQTPEDETVWVFYVDREITPEKIRRCFEFAGHVLFVVDDKLIPQDITDRQSTPMWLRVLHGLYMGRVYTWNGRFLYGLHFDYDAGVINESGAIQPDSLWLHEHGTWLRGWSGSYRTARFFDRAWWFEGGGFQGGKYEQPKWGSEQQRRSYYEGQWTPPPNNEPPKYRYGGSEQRQGDDARKHGGYWTGQGNTTDDPSENWKKQETKRDFMREFMACANHAAAKALYRKLVLEFHPDKNLDRDTTATMQQINAAWDKAQKVWA